MKLNKNKSFLLFLWSEMEGMSFISAAAPIKDKWIYLLIYAFVGYMFWAPAAHTFLLLSLHSKSINYSIQSTLNQSINQKKWS